MKRATALLLIIISVLTIFTACDEETSTDLYYPVTEDFGTLDPQVASVPGSRMVAFNCFEGLVRLDENRNIVAAGADSWTVSSDSREYVFSLKRDARWYLTNTSKEAFSGNENYSDLLPADFDNRVTAKDYAFGLKRALDPATGSAEGKYLTAITNGEAVQKGELTTDALGITVVDDYTLRITLDYADPNFLYYLTRLAAMPCNETFFKACKGRYGLDMKYMLCNGVYMVYRWTQKSVIRMEKNSLYTGSDKAKNDRVWIYYVEDASSVPEKIRKGTYDAGYVPSASLELFDDEFTVSPLSDVLWGYWFNCKSDIFSSTALRKAFAASADLSLIEAPSYIEASADRLLTNTLSPYYDYTPEPIAYNESTALGYYKTAVAESENVSATINVSVLTTPDFEAGIKKQIQIWQRVFGIDVKINVQPEETALRMFSAGNYQIAFLPVTITSSNTAEYFRTFRTDSAYNASGYSNEFYDNLIDSLSNNMTDEQKINLFRKCEQTVISDGAVIPAFTEASYFITGKESTGIYSFSSGEIYFRNGTVLS